MTFIHGGKRGWEVPVVNGNPEFFSGIPNDDKKEIRVQLAMQTRIARSVETEHEFNELNKRIDKSDWKEILEKNLKGKDLVRWAFTTPTSEEFYNHLRYQ